MITLSIFTQISEYILIILLPLLALYIVYLVITKAFKDMDVHRLLFTKIDESSTYGNIVNLLIRTNIPLSFLCCGRKVPDDIEAGTIEKLVDLDVPERAQVIRVVLTELQRIASHLVWLATQSLDLAAQSVFLYCFREREIVLDLLELVSGQRMMTTYIRPGGVWRDVPEEFYAAVDEFVEMFPKRIAQYDGLLTKNPLPLNVMQQNQQFIRDVELVKQRKGFFIEHKAA